MALKSCQCCCATMRLEKAAKIIGIIFTIMGAISVLSFAVKLAQMDAGHDQIVSDLSQLFPRQDAEQKFQHARTLLVVRLVVVILFTLFSAILVAGVYRYDKRMVLAFVVFYMLKLAIVTIAVFYAFYDPSVLIDEMTIVQLRQQDADMAKVIIYVSLGVVLAIYAFLWYLAIVVYSYYKEMVRGGPALYHRELC